MELISSHTLDKLFFKYWSLNREAVIFKIKYILCHFIIIYLNSKILFTTEKWSKKIYTRKKFLKMLCVKKNITSEKLEHLKKSFYTINYKSLYQISNNKKKFIKFN